LVIACNDYTILQLVHLNCPFLTDTYVYADIVEFELDVWFGRQVEILDESSLDYQVGTQEESVFPTQLESYQQKRRDLLA
jgi:hypothetical protein